MNFNSDFWSTCYLTFCIVTVGERRCMQLYPSLLTAADAGHLLAVDDFSLCWIPTTQSLKNPYAGLTHLHVPACFCQLWTLRLQKYIYSIFNKRSERKSSIFAFRYGFLQFNWNLKELTQITWCSELSWYSWVSLCVVLFF